MAPFSVLSKIFGLVKSNNGALSSKRQRRLAEVAERVRAKFLRQSLEDLEQRWLPVVSFNLVGTSLTIFADSNNDDVFLTATNTGNVILSSPTASGFTSPYTFTSANALTDISVTGPGSGFTSFLTVNGTGSLRNPAGGNLSSFTAGQFSAITLSTDLTGAVSGTGSITNVRVFPGASLQDGVSLSPTTVTTFANGATPYTTSESVTLSCTSTTLQVTNLAVLSGDISVSGGLLQLLPSGSILGNITLTSFGCLTSGGNLASSCVTSSSINTVCITQSTAANFLITQGCFSLSAGRNISGTLIANNVASLNLLGSSNGTISIADSVTACISSLATNITIGTGASTVCITNTGNVTGSALVGGGNFSILSGGVVSNLAVSGTATATVRGTVLGNSSISGGTLIFTDSYVAPNDLNVTGGTVTATTRSFGGVLTQSGGTVTANSIGTRADVSGGTLTVNGTLPTLNQSGSSSNVTITANGSVSNTTNVTGGLFLNLGNVSGFSVDGTANATNNGTINGNLIQNDIIVYNGTLTLNSSSNFGNLETVNVVVYNNGILYQQSNLSNNATGNAESSIVLNNFSCGTLARGSSQQAVSVLNNATLFVDGNITGSPGLTANGSPALAINHYSTVTIQSNAIVSGNIATSESSLLTIGGNITGNAFINGGTTTVVSGGVIGGLTLITDGTLNVNGTNATSYGRIGDVYVGY
ncbi:MAG: beta strand repeat-containing protein, partial [bacterium]